MLCHWVHMSIKNTSNALLLNVTFAKDSTEHSWLYMPNLYMQNERQSRSKINARIFVHIRNWHNNTIMYPTLFCTRVTTFRKEKKRKKTNCITLV